MVTLNDLKKKAPARAAAHVVRAPAPDITGLAPGVYKGKINLYAQTINGVDELKPGEKICLNGNWPKEDTENGYDETKVRSKRVRVAVADVTFTIR